MPVHALQLHPDDDVAVAVSSLESGMTLRLAGLEVSVAEPIRMGHKVALRSLGPGEPVRKYGQPIGVTTEAVEAGTWVHLHNLKNNEFEQEYGKASDTPPLPAPIRDRTFQGYRRNDGRAGTRNYLAVISSVNCSASVSRYIARHFTSAQLAEWPRVDGVLAMTHEGGCGMPFAGLQHDMLNRVLGGMARHPNIGGFLLVGLGCEQGALGYLVQEQRLVQIGGTSPPTGGGPAVLSIQDQGGTQRTIEEGVRRVAEMLPRVNDVRRESIPASELIVATECGGSDGYSGITANPAVGVASDRVVACGGTAILGETTEIYGAEQLLTRRAVSAEVADKLLDRIAWWKWYAGVFGAELDNNPSVGNREGGITTIAEKSLGAVAKAGSTALRDVFQYAEPVTSRGFVIMDTPGYDPPSVTGMVAGGATVVVFTTGRGSCFGCKPAPSIKVATNTPMYERLRDDMDINAGRVIDGGGVAEVGEEIFEKILQVASGEPTKSEALGIGDEEFVPWMVGPTL